MCGCVARQVRTCYGAGMRQNVYIPEALAARFKVYRRWVNLSALVQSSLEAELDRLEADPDLAAIIEIEHRRAGRAGDSAEAGRPADLQTAYDTGTEIDTGGEV